jgi:hypothetical protein
LGSKLESLKLPRVSALLRDSGNGEGIVDPAESVQWDLVEDRLESRVLVNEVEVFRSTGNEHIVGNQQRSWLQCAACENLVGIRHVQALVVVDEVDLQGKQRKSKL